MRSLLEEIWLVKMPPSPALRISPSREVRAENHRRGRSLEGGLIFKDKDDDLALFKDMQNRERDNFLLQPADDFEDSLCNFHTHAPCFAIFFLGCAPTLYFRFFRSSLVEQTFLFHCSMRKI